MSDDKKTILIVDDSKNDIEFLLQSVQGEYKVLVATNGEQAIELARKSLPDVILMDVEMPGMDGYEACKKIKGDDDLENIDVIFVSAHDTVDEIMLGYEAGGSDYVVKPIAPTTLLEKIRLALHNQSKRQALSEQKANAFQTAMAAMSNAGEIGIILNFVRNSFNAKTVEDLSGYAFKAMEELDVKGALQVRINNEVLNMGSGGLVTPIEENIMNRSSSKTRIKSYKNNLIITYPLITLLVGDMPVDSEDQLGRYRDHLAILAECLNEEAYVLSRQKEQDIQNDLLTDIVAKSKSQLLTLQDAQKEHKRINKKIGDDMLEDLQACFLPFDLRDEQEGVLVELLSSHLERGHTHYVKGLELDKELRSIIEEIIELVP